MSIWSRIKAVFEGESDIVKAIIEAKEPEIKAKLTELVPTAAALVVSIAAAKGLTISDEVATAIVSALLTEGEKLADEEIAKL